MNASIPGSDDWWKVIRTMPATEALMYLNDYRAALIAENKPNSPNHTAQLTKINNEIKRINLSRDNNRWYNACRNVLPPELFEAVRAEKARLENSL